MDKEPNKPSAPKSPKQIEYAVSVIVNAALLVIFNNLLSWGVLPWLTSAFRDALWIINSSLIATIVANVVFFFFSPDWFLALLRFVLNVIGLVVVVTLLRVFPFNFSAYAANWTLGARIILIGAIVAISLGIIVELLKFVSAVLRRR